MQTARALGDIGERHLEHDLPRPVLFVFFSSGRERGDKNSQILHPQSSAN